jgi:dTDP-4-amino-4,6-dideoxygalactose transaminase
MIKYNQTNIVLNDSDMKEIKTIIESGNVVNGKYVKELEKFLKHEFGVKHAIPCANCTTGLIIAIKAMGLQGKSIAVPAFTWFSTPYAICCNYNVPYFVDINKDTWLMEDFNETYVDAFLSVDIFGNKSFVKTNLPVIYDAAHGYGLTNLGHRGNAEVISLSYTKIVQGMQGGVILTNDDVLAEKCRTMVHRYGKITELNAYIVLKSIGDYLDNQSAREKIINEYHKLIKVPCKEQVIKTETNYSVYAILLETTEIRDKINDALIRNGVETKIYYQPVVEDTEYFRRAYPNTFDLYSRILALPVYTDLEVGSICKIINEAI